MPSRLSIARQDIVAYLEGQEKRVLRRRDLAEALRENRATWRLTQSLTAEDFITYLLARTRLKAVRLTSEHYRSLELYTWGDVSRFRIAVSVRPKAYFSHGSAVFLHGLTDQLPATLYVNQEQSPKPAARGELTQAGLDRAFSRPQRQSKMVYNFAKTSVVVLSGKNTGQLEVGRLPGPDGEPLPATKLERTLIDIAVRPAYAGGVHHVLESFITAKDRLSTNLLLRTLKRLGYRYPYHQAIGFYMQRAGYADRQYEPLRQLGLKYDFHLCHGIQEKAYNEDWRLYHPEGF